jgi:hypothetical protein
MGSIEGQRNFVVKAMVQSLKNDIDQFYTFVLADSQPENTATNAWQLMGFYYDLTNTQPYQATITPNGIAFRTAANHLHSYNSYDANLSAQLTLPDEIDGGAFRNEADEILFVLWAKTNIDRSEQATATYTFPVGMGLNGLSLRQWNYSQNEQVQNINGTTVSLTGSPVFLLPGNGLTNNSSISSEIASATIVPNPIIVQQAHLTINLTEATFLTGDLFHSNGQLVSELITPQQLSAGKYQFPFTTDDLSAGVYFCQLKTEQGVKTIRIVVVD